MPGDSALERFREETGQPGGRPRPRGFRPPVPIRQKLLVINALVWFAVTLFWFRAGLDLVGHYVSAGLGLWTFLCVILPPFGFGTDRPDGTAGSNLKRLLKFPVFWLGLLVLGYGILQTINYAYALQIVPGKGGRMVEVPHIEWLPAGVSIPARFTASPRAGLLQIALPWLMVCSLYAGLRSRRTLDWLLNGALAVLFLWSLMALGYYYTKATSIYWGIEMGKNNTPWFWGTIKDPNHGAILQVLGLLVCLALAGRGFRRSLAVGKLGGVQLFYLALALFFSLATLQSLSRAGIVLMVLIWVIALLGGGWIAYRERSMRLVSVFAGFFIVLVGVGTVVVAVNLQGQGRKNPFVQTLNSTTTQLEDLKVGNTVDNRVLLNRVSQRMLKTSPVFGYGVGSWSVFYRRFANPMDEFNILFIEVWARDRKGNALRRDGKAYQTFVPLRFDHAHNEYLQYLCEFGLVGASMVGLLVFWIPGTIVLRYRQAGFISLVAVAASGVILLHSAIEFPTRTPALGLLFGLLLAAGAMDAAMRRESGGQDPER